LGVRWVEKDVLYRECDIISLHVPLTPSTQNMLSAREFAGMKPSAMIINTARGGLVNEADLAQALRSGRLAAAALDVFEKEPYSGELASVPQCLLTCHMGSMSADCRRRMELEAALEAVRFIRKEPPASLVPEEEYEMAKNSKSGRPES
jgi:D-3-phosphoglycerate dehydrogenase / 2-oxoglutarate reductase